ncbi:MAG: hypothetical protein RIR26_618 [Pseudomonadota bacterium]
MKLAELCTVYPSHWNDPAPLHPGAAIPMDVRLKLKAQRGHLQAALDTHVQRTSNRSGLGLRPYTAGDALRAVSLRHLLLQEELVTRTDVSAGRFRVAILVHCYSNMEFRSEESEANKMQLAWATAGVLENIHQQQAQKIDIIPLNGPHLSDEIRKQAARIKRAHFCYVLTDLLFNPKDVNASATELDGILKHLRIPHGVVVVIRDFLESPAIAESRWIENDAALAFAPPDQAAAETDPLPESTGVEHHSGQTYLKNVVGQLNELESELNNRGWTSLWLTAAHPLETMTRRLSARLSALRVGL